MNQIIFDKLDTSFYLYLFAGVMQCGSDGSSFIYEKGGHHESFKTVRDYAVRHHSSSRRILGDIRSVAFKPAEDSDSHIIVAFEGYADWRIGLPDMLSFCAYYSKDYMARKSSRRTMRRALAYLQEERVKLANDNKSW